MEPSALGKALRARRGDVSQTVFAERIGRRQSTLSAWETGANGVSMETYVEIAQILGLSDEEIRADVSRAAAEIAAEAGANARAVPS